MRLVHGMRSNLFILSSMRRALSSLPHQSGLIRRRVCLRTLPKTWIKTRGVATQAGRPDCAGNRSVVESDPEVAKLIHKEHQRQVGVLLNIM
jgi:hypothetical protein